MPNASKLRNDIAREPPAEEAGPLLSSGWLRTAAQIATIGIFILMLGIVLSLARGVLRPIAAALIVIIMLGPVARLVVARRFPPVVFALLVVGALVALIHLATMVLSGPVANLINILPTSVPVITQKFAAFGPLLDVVHHWQNWLGGGAGTSAFTFDFGAVLQAVVAYLTPALGELIVFLAALFLGLVSRDNLRRNLILFFPDQDERLRVIQILNELELRLTQYMGTISAINLAVGLSTAILCWLVGLPAPALFGILAFICNFVPYIGAGFTLLSLTVAGLIVFPMLTDALIAPAIFLVLATIEGQLITPALVGQRITISPLAVFISLAFWIWLWGPVGGFLSVPFLIIGYTVLSRLRSKANPELPG